MLGYKAFAGIIDSLLERGELLPVKASGTNGRNPYLYNKYRLVFNNEKFLDSKGATLLKRLGFSIKDLNCYKTLEAFFYILFKPKERLNVLIIENKDTFYSVLKYLERKPEKDLFGINIDMLIYGEAKKIINSFSFINEVAMDMTIEKVYYFGDLDFEGIGIFNFMASKYGKDLVVPHVNLYKELLVWAKNPPFMRTNQKEIYLDPFLMYFDEESKTKISESEAGTDDTVLVH